MCCHQALLLIFDSCYQWRPTRVGYRVFSFILYINDLESLLSASVSIKVFANDLKIYSYDHDDDDNLNDFYSALV